MLPLNIEDTSSVQDIKEAVELYWDDLPNADLIDEEYCVWKSRWISKKYEERPSNLSMCMKECSPMTLPNLFTLLKLFATLPLSSCSCEQSASALRRLNNYLRASQTEERLSALALINCNYTERIDIDTVCRLFIQKHPRRMESASMLFD